MGAQESHLNHQQHNQLKVLSSKGYHVLRVADSSPASEAGIEPFFDYIVGIGGQAITEDGDALTNWLDQSEGQMITLQVYSSRRQEIRNIRALPNRKWSSSNYNNNIQNVNHPQTDQQQQQQPSLLGLSLRLCCPENALANVWHVLDIVEGSPAQDAGLVPFGDWIIGYSGGILRGENDFYEVVEEHEDRPLRLFVYSADYEVTREVVIVPNRSWGSGDGLLGCSIGFGLLHRIPKTTTKTTAPSYLVPDEVNKAIDSYVDEEEREMLKDFSKTSSMAVTDVIRSHQSIDQSISNSSTRKDLYQNNEDDQAKSKNLNDNNRLEQFSYPNKNNRTNAVIEEEEEET